MDDFDQFERRLGTALRSDADESVGPFEAGSIARAAIAGTQARTVRLPGASSRPAGRFRRRRGITLLAAAAVLLVGGAMAAVGGGLRLPSVVPPVPAPSFGLVSTASPDVSPNPSDVARPSAAPTSSAVAGPGGVWIATGAMITPSYDNIAVRLADGRVLVAGGLSDGSDLTSAELYDPATGTWSVTGRPIHPLGSVPATLLPDGRVLVGDARPGDYPDGAELYDPTTGTWTATGKPPSGVGLATATLLRDGKVLMVRSNGGQLYDPVSGTWTATGKMVTPRYDHTATLLLDGRVLVAGGYVPPDVATSSAELYDPDAGSWTAIAKTGFGGGTATLLQDGKVLFAGPSRVYDPATGTWTPTGDMGWSVAGFAPPPTRLLDGTVLSDGGLYDPATRSWTKTGSMLYDGGSATLLLDGTVLVTGGTNGTGATSSAELYIPAGASPPPDLAPVPSPAPTPTPTPFPTPYPPQAGPVPLGARSWTVTVNNRTSTPGTLFLAEDGENGIGQLCGSVTPNVVPAGVTEKVTFLLPPKRVTSCWIWVDPVPGQGGSLFQTSEAPKAGSLVIWMQEHGPAGAWGGNP